MHLYFVPFTDAELIINLLIDCLVSCALLAIFPSYNDMGLPVKECFCQFIPTCYVPYLGFPCYVML